MNPPTDKAMTPTQTHTPGHIPGPWTVDYSGLARLAITGAGGETLAFCNWQCEDGDVDEANARLIAAAPELLGALERVVDAFQTDSQVSPNLPVLISWETNQNAIAQARAAIARATGQA